MTVTMTSSDEVNQEFGSTGIKVSTITLSDGHSADQSYGREAQNNACLTIPMGQKSLFLIKADADINHMRDVGVKLKEMTSF